MKGHHYIILVVLLSVGAWYAVKRGWLRKPAMSSGTASGSEGAA